MLVLDSTSTLSNSKIHSSESRGIVISGSNVNLLNVSSRKNNTNNTQGLSGVGIYVFDSDILFNSVVIDSNMNFDHNGDGAGVYIYESDGMISDLSSFKNIGGHGTGLFIENSNIDVKNSKTTKNSGIAGSGINIIKSFVTIDSTLIDSNTTTEIGLGYGG